MTSKSLGGCLAGSLSWDDAHGGWSVLRLFGEVRRADLGCVMNAVRRIFPDITAGKRCLCSFLASSAFAFLTESAFSSSGEQRFVLLDILEWG